MARGGGIEDDVWWTGRLESAEISRALQAADVFVLTQPDGHVTRSSGFMAAAVHGLPVVAVRNSANQVEFTHGENIWLVEHSTPQEIAAALTALLEDRAAAGRMGGNLQKLYHARFDWRVTVARPPAAHAGSALSEGLSAATKSENAVTAAHAGGVKQ
jgi:glycosyltransferase involved in cell wall biosynthesis